MLPAKKKRRRDSIKEEEESPPPIVTTTTTALGKKQRHYFVSVCILIGPVRPNVASDTLTSCVSLYHEGSLTYAIIAPYLATMVMRHPKGTIARIVGTTIYEIPFHHDLKNSQTPMLDRPATEGCVLYEMCKAKTI